MPKYLSNHRYAINMPPKQAVDAPILGNLKGMAHHCRSKREHLWGLLHQIGSTWACQHPGIAGFSEFSREFNAQAGKRYTLGVTRKASKLWLEAFSPIVGGVTYFLGSRSGLDPDNSDWTAKLIAQE